MPIEATLAENHVLVAAPEVDLGVDLFGTVVTPGALGDVTGKTVYVLGDARPALPGAARVIEIDDVGKLPVRIGNAGVYYRRFFDGEYFHRIVREHEFQALTESSKPSKAHRTGIYLTPVTSHGDELHFHLLRCSTNLAGPTENFRTTDEQIVGALNDEAARIFENAAPLNHVLAQIYNNTPATDGQKQTKAKISSHADKTKDMPVNGIMAFCTFYDGLDKLSPIAGDPFDLGYKGKSGLTKLQFRLKEAAIGTGLPTAFTLTLYPGSVFFMPLSTNRLYTHEIASSMLNAEMLPTRLGYVVRCSKTVAIHHRGTTFLELGGRRVPMEPPTEQGVAALRALYAAENRSTDVIDYGDRFLFSMNAGDYLAPRR